MPPYYQLYVFHCCKIILVNRIDITTKIIFRTKVSQCSDVTKFCTCICPIFFGRGPKNVTTFCYRDISRTIWKYLVGRVPYGEQQGVTQAYSLPSSNLADKRRHASPYTQQNKARLFTSLSKKQRHNLQLSWLSFSYKLDCQNSKCCQSVSVWMLTRVEQILTAAQRLVILHALMNPDRTPKTRSV